MSILINPRHLTRNMLIKSTRIRLFQSSISKLQGDDNDSSTTYMSRCDLNVVSSPYPSIPSPPYPSLSDFISLQWETPHVINKVAIIDGTTNETRTFGEYHKTMCNIAASLSDMSINSLSKVALFCPNNVDYVPISLSITMIGAKLVPINPAFKTHELEFILNHSKAQVLFVHSSVLDVALKTVKSMDSSVKHVIVIPEAGDDENRCPEGTISLNSLKAHAKPLVESNKDINSGKDFAVLPFSSGTTGLPKGVCLSHENIISNLYQIEEIDGIACPNNHKLITPLPFFHIFAFSLSALWCAWRCQQLITMSKFDFETYCSLIEKYKPERGHIVPPIILALAKSPIVDKYDLSSLKMLICGAAPLSSEIENAVNKRLGMHVKQGWGMSESSPLGLLNSDYNMKSGSCGHLVSDTNAKIVDVDTGRSLGPNESGELLIKGPQVMLGYLNNPSATMECLDSNTGWMKTGDLAHYDTDNFIYITDRIKELIKVKGMQVPPAELEALLLTHEAIQDVVVTPVANEEYGQLPKASVVLKPNFVDKVKENDIVKWVKERVASYKQLGGGVVFVDTVPKSASGKILRRLVAE